MSLAKATDQIKDGTQIMECKNCGCSCISNYCPNCGQSTKEKRLENRTFFIGLISGLSRINKGFLFTAWNLLIHPWKVIRDYIQCRRVRYVAPISMLILVCFISTFVGALFSAETQPVVIGMSDANVPVFHHIILSAGYFLMNNALAQNLTVYLPALLAIPIVYGKAGAGRYNMAEYLTAMIYMATSFIIFNVITLPISILSDDIYSALGFGYSILICAMSMYFAFPIDSKKRRVGYFALYLLTALLIYLIILVILGIALGMGNVP
jgi:hypothetical protein